MEMLTRVLIVGAAAATLASCSKSQHQPPTQDVEQKIKSPDVFVIPPCDSTIPNSTYTYVLTLGKDFDLHEAVSSKTGPVPRGNPKPHPHKTRLDVRTTVAVGQSATIKILLAEDSLLTFQEKGAVVRGADKDAPLIFCGVTDAVYEPRVGWSVSFTTYRKSAAPNYATYNLGLIAGDKKDSTFSLPIFIDPGVDNEG